MGTSILLVLLGFCLGISFMTLMAIRDRQKELAEDAKRCEKRQAEKSEESKIENWTITKTVTVGGKVEYSHTPIHYHHEEMQPYRKELIDFIRHNGAMLTDEKVSAKLEQLREQYKAAQIASTTILK